MNTIRLNPQLQAELEKFAREHGQTFGCALDDAVATYLESQNQEFEEDVSAVQAALQDLEAGRSVSLEDFDRHMRQRYGISR